MAKHVNLSYRKQLTAWLDNNHPIPTRSLIVNSKEGSVTTVSSKRSIFRSSALQHYMEGREKDVLPRIISPPIFRFLWLIFGLLSMAGVIAWWGRIPIYSTGKGAITASSQTHPGDKQAVAIVFLPAEQLPKLRPGQQVVLQIGTTGQRVSRTIERVEPQVLSPTQARQRYRLDDAALLSVTQPSAIVTVNLKGSGISATTYPGSIVSAQIELGSTRLISLLPLLEKVIGD